MFHCNENKSQNYHNQSIKEISVLFFVPHTQTNTHPQLHPVISLSPFEPRQKKLRPLSYIFFSIGFFLFFRKLSTKFAQRNILK